MSANDSFKLKYPRYLKGAILAVLALTVLFIWQWPGYEAQPYQLRQKEEMFWVDLADPVDIPEPPAPMAPPRVLPNIEAVSEDYPDLLDPDWTPPSFWDPSPSYPIDAPTYDGFVSSSSLPRLTFMAKASYPEIARRMRVEGTVMVHVLVGPDGKVDQAVVIQTVHPSLDSAAVIAAKKCLFSPALQRQLKVKAWVAIPFNFKLN